MPPQQAQADCFLSDLDDLVVVKFEDFSTDHHIVGADDNQIASTATMKDESTKQAAHQFDLLDEDNDNDEHVPETNDCNTCLFPYLFQFKKKISSGVVVRSIQVQ